MCYLSGNQESRNGEWPPSERRNHPHLPSSDHLHLPSFADPTTKRRPTLAPSQPPVLSPPRPDPQHDQMATWQAKKAREAGAHRDAHSS